MSVVDLYPWLPQAAIARIGGITEATAGLSSGELASRLEMLAVENRKIHERDCFNLNPATNVMNPRAEALLASGLGSRPSLGYPGDKYEMGLEAIEEIEVIAANLACEIFQSSHSEIRVASGALANLYAFMATTNRATRSSPRRRRSEVTSPITRRAVPASTASTFTKPRWTRTAIRSTWTDCAPLR